MPTYRVERTEFHTRVWIIEADSAEDAEDRYLDEEDDEEESWHDGCADVTVEEIVDRCEKAE